ncbi:hypothetical protein ECP03052936_1728 [Escherichia coli p0305293.6]|nr:hypothetical protein ECP03052936_1728 [Escherichia coli p0305293.6]
MRKVCAAILSAAIVWPYPVRLHGRLTQPPERGYLHARRTSRQDI